MQGSKRKEAESIVNCTGCEPDQDEQSSIKFRSCDCGWDQRLIRQSTPWRNEIVLNHLYNCEGHSLESVGDIVGCGETCVLKWMDRNGIARRDMSEAAKIRFSDEPVPFRIHDKGYEVWDEGYDGNSPTIYVHRLAAVAWYGFEEVCSSQIHHQSEVPWLNIDGNDWSELGIVPLSRAEHKKEHYRVSDQSLLQAVAENGDKGTTRVGDSVGLSGTSLQMRIRRLERNGLVKSQYRDRERGGTLRQLSLTEQGQEVLND
ncbi:hypothetical protein [Halalkalicoccus sp. NIPERK01]|uniref:hypothetical protein n=1 Tax=Halalkalicoccus sp. NIPERK01 TaxID=3053469 RepID=UPI00256F21BB|nr:hypothetical protein [Halalkalicoccus sp. NIPERK01]MDL5361311.1 hypothetical protein [Halalkalicoccus sp. NIPERK01]